MSDFDIEKRIQQAKDRGFIGTQPIEEIWHLLDDVEYIVPWKASHPGSSSVYKIWEDVAPTLKQKNIYFYRHLKSLMAEFATYQH